MTSEQPSVMPVSPKEIMIGTLIWKLGIKHDDAAAAANAILEAFEEWDIDLVWQPFEEPVAPE